MDLQTIAQRSWEQHKRVHPKNQQFAYFKAPGLAPAVPPEEDPTVLILDRFLNRGRYCLLAGPSNEGKSVLAYYLTMAWSKGVPALGMKPRTSVRSLFIQCEMAETKTDQITWDLKQDLGGEWTENDMVMAKLRFPLQGQPLLDLLDETLDDSGFDLLVLDPLFGAVDLDLTDQKESAQFFRSQFPGLLLKHDLAGLVIHHTTKGIHSAPLDADDMDLRIAIHGSGDIVNAAQSSLMLRTIPKSREVAEYVGGLQQLRAVKEGNELGWTDENGAPCRQKVLRTGYYKPEPGEPIRYRIDEADPVDYEKLFEAHAGKVSVKSPRPGRTDRPSLTGGDPSIDPDLRDRVEDIVRLEGWISLRDIQARLEQEFPEMEPPHWNVFFQQRLPGTVSRQSRHGVNGLECREL